MSGMGDTLGKEVGPLPLGAWIAVVGVGLGIAYYTRTHSSTPTIVNDTSGTPGVGVGGSGQWTQVGPGTGAGTGGVAPKPTTNEEWGQQGINFLISMGYPPATADSAVRKYLTGAKLSVQEFSLITELLAFKGTPPQSLPPRDDGGDPPVVVNPPTSPPPAATTYPHTWLVTPGGDNLFWIWHWYKDRGFTGEWWDIWNANQGVWSNNTINARAPIGTELHIP